MSDGFHRLENLTFAGIINPLTVFAYAKLGYDSNHPWSSDPTKGIKIENATECSLALCLKEYDVAVRNGVAVKNVTAVDYGQVFQKDTNLGPNRARCWRPTNSAPDIPFEHHTWHGSWYSTSSVKFAFCGGPGMIQIKERIFAGSNWMNRSWKKGNQYDGLPSYDPNTERVATVGLEKIMSNVADSVNKMTLLASGKDVGGIAYGMEVFVEVQWLWLILPALLVVSGIFFFILAIFANKKSDTVLWKSSVLAFLYHGFPDVNADDCTTASKMEEKAKGLEVQLHSSDQEGDLMLRRAKSPAIDEGR